jgi:RHS repeat-associated protein
MQDHELYRRILGIETPWQVERVELKLEAGEVHVHLCHKDEKEWACPECGRMCRLYEHQPERQWRHLDTCQYQTILHAEPPRSECGEHGVGVVKLPWAEPGSNCTAQQNAADNGNILQILDLLNSNNTQSFSYDNLNRLATFSNGGGNMQQTYTIDPWGNLIQSGTLSSGLSFSGATTNRDTSGTLSFDNDGNVIAWNNYYGGNTTNYFTYDPEGRILSVDNGAATYTYNPEGDRVRKDSGGAWTEYLYFNGMPLTELDSNANWTDYIFANGTRLAQAGSSNPTNPSASTSYYSSDQIGSTRIMTDGSGNVISANEFYPFGQGPEPTSSNHYLFTGKERDSESGNDYFGARYYGSSMGRFLSPDWSEEPDTVPYAEFENPQTLNLYSYGNNNPLLNNDPDGHSVNVCTNDANGNQQCTLLSNEQYEASQQGNGSLNVPTLDQVGNNQTNGTFNATAITDANGNTVGTATYSPDNPGIDPFVGNNMAGYQQLSNTSKVVTAGTAIYAGVYGAAFLGPEAVAGIARFANTLRAGMTIGGYILSQHAVEQAEERGVTLSEIEDAVQGVAKGTLRMGGTLL